MFFPFLVRKGLFTPSRLTGRSTFRQRTFYTIRTRLRLTNHGRLSVRFSERSVWNSWICIPPIPHICTPRSPFHHWWRNSSSQTHSFWKESPWWSVCSNTWYPSNHWNRTFRRWTANSCNKLVLVLDRTLHHNQTHDEDQWNCTHLLTHENNYWIRWNHVHVRRKSQIRT